MVRTCSSSPIPDPMVMPSEEALYWVASYLRVVPSALTVSK